jgi:hypothetical protein
LPASRRLGSVVLQQPLVSQRDDFVCHDEQSSRELGVIHLLCKLPRFVKQLSQFILEGTNVCIGTFSSYVSRQATNEARTVPDFDPSRFAQK